VAITDSVLCAATLKHLARDAPALQKLHFTLADHPAQSLVPLLGSLAQLRELTLCRWFYKWEDVPCIRHLSSLQSLEVVHTLACSIFLQEWQWWQW